MVGVLVYIMIGFILFTPIGFIAGYIQHKNSLKNQDEKDPDSFSDNKTSD